MQEIVKYYISPTKEVLDIINSTKPIELTIIKGKYINLSKTNILIYEPIKYKAIYKNYYIEFYEYNKKDIKGNNFYNLNNKKSFNINELKNILLDF